MLKLHGVTLPHRKHTANLKAVKMGEDYIVSFKNAARTINYEYACDSNKVLKYFYIIDNKQFCKCSSQYISS